MIQVSVSEPSQVAAARRAVADAARSGGLGAADAARAALAVTELATNLIRHGGGGEVLIEPAAGTLTIVALDRGRGMADVLACLSDGYSTAGTPGNGLGAVMRQVEDFDIYSIPAAGTAVLARLREARRVAAPARFAIGAVNVPIRGEQVSGDAWEVLQNGTQATVIVADGLGHGAVAAVAGSEATRLFRKSAHLPLREILAAVHAGLRPTRGAAVAIARIDLANQTVLFGGIGNIAGTLSTEGKISRMVSLNGTAGHIAPQLREFTYPFAGSPLVFLCSDGLSTSWSLDSHPGLVSHDPALIAAVLYRDHARGRDDVTVVAVQGRVT